MKRLFKIYLGIISLLANHATAEEQAFAIDTIEFGHPGSEGYHMLQTKRSKMVKGELDQLARQLLPPEEEGWRGGMLTFMMKCDPQKPNYFTVKFWGGDTASKDEYESRLCLFLEGKQVGYRHLGDVETLDIMWHKAPRYPGRFYYKTLPLPFHITKGKKIVTLTIEAQGGINGYAPKIDSYQKMMKEPSRPIYKAYVHTDPCFIPAKDDVQGKPPASYPLRKEPGIELIEQLKDRLNRHYDKVMKRGDNMHHEEIQYLAETYHTPWHKGYKKQEAIEKIVEGLDNNYLALEADPDMKYDWWGKGPAADAVYLVFDQLKPYLSMNVKGTNKSRRDAYIELFLSPRNFNAARRRSYTNQSMFVDLNIYYANRALLLLRSREAWAEKTARRLLYESMGLELWSGHWDEKGNPSWSHGKSKLLLTDKGLTKELGYVGAYGEIVTDSARLMYEATKTSPTSKGDLRIRNQLIKLVRARAPFRYPLVDEDGYKAMNLESIVGWRDWHYPGGVFYDQTNGMEGGSFEIALSTGDPVLMGYGQQLLEDNQYFAALDRRINSRNSTSKMTRILAVPENYQKILALPPQKARLPMTKGQPDFVFSDPQDGVIAIKNGDDILYTSLYWRARHSINNLARVHYLTPTMERDATVNIKTEFNDSGNVYTIPDRTNQPFGRGREERFYHNEGMHSAMAGQKQPIAKVPEDDESYNPGDENIYAGKGDFYLMEFGSYYIAMNCTEKKTFHFNLPQAFKGSKDLVSGYQCNIPKVKVSPMQTIVLYREPN